MQENNEQVVTEEVKPVEYVPVDEIVGQPTESNNSNNNYKKGRSTRELVLIVIAALTMIASGVYFAFFNEDDEEESGNNNPETVEKEDKKETTNDETNKNTSDETKKEENNNTQSNEINDKDRFSVIQDKSTITYYKENITDKTMSNADCGGILKFSLKTENGKIFVTDSNTGETAEFTKINNPKAMTIIPEGYACDLNIYVILTDSGDIYYENVDIQHIKNVKDLENDFKLLKTDYKFSDISIIYENESHYVLSSNTKDNKLIRIELYDQFLKTGN